MEAVIRFIDQYWLFFTIVIGTILLIVATHALYKVFVRAQSRKPSFAPIVKKMVVPESKIMAEPEVVIETVPLPEPVTQVSAPVSQPEIQIPPTEIKPLSETKTVPEPLDPALPISGAKTNAPVIITAPVPSPVETVVKPIPPLLPAKSGSKRVGSATSNLSTLHSPLPPVELEKGEKPKLAVDKKPKTVTPVPKPVPKPKPKKKLPPKFHVLYRSTDENWYVKKEGNDAIIRVLETYREAVSFATIKALSSDSTVVVHRKDGKILKQSSLKDVMDSEEDD
jgi:hypothetical protein